MLPDPLAGVRFQPSIYALCVHSPLPPPTPYFKTLYLTLFFPLMLATYSSSENAAGVNSEWPINIYFL